MSEFNIVSRHLGPAQLRAIAKAGDILIPGGGEMPRFSDTPALTEIDRMVDYMSDSDRGGFKFLMGLFDKLPSPAIRGLMKIADRAESLPSFIAPPFRLINVGVKGVVYTLYYTDVTGNRSIFRGLGWETRCGEAAVRNPDPTLAAVEDAFAVAREAAPTLARLPVSERVRAIARLRDVVLAKREYWIDEIQKSTGKSRTDALMSEIFPVLDHLHWLEKNATKMLAPRTVPTPIALMGKKSSVVHDPLGVVLAICPWNYPFFQAIVPTTSAIVCGNTVVYKPSEVTPMQGVIEELFREARIPSDWMQIIYGDGRVGSAAIEQRPDKIFFIGSSGTGGKILEQASKHLIPVELELGGKDPMIVFEDANLDRAAAGGVWGALTNTGQSCTSVERILVQESVYDGFRERVLRDVSRITQGVDKDGSADIGLMTTDAQTRIVAEHLEDALAKGARLLSGGEWDRKSRAIPPLVLDGLTADMKIVREETFGPVIALLPFATEEEAIRISNDSEYGLSASVWTNDRRRAERVARRLAVGNVSINNVMLTEANPGLPFGGVRRSGMGRYKGEQGFAAFSNVKSILVDANSRKIEANWYPYTPERYRAFDAMMTGLFGRGFFSLLKFAVNGLKLESLAQKLKKG
jgi:acyl-CoA reductase-like NAD-dependent aldehyde dehydrogenase